MRKFHPTRDTGDVTPPPSKAPLRTKTPSPLPRLSQSKNSHAAQKLSRPTSPTFSTKSSTSKTSSNFDPKKQPCPTPQNSRRKASQAIPSPTYLPFAKVQARMSTTKLPAARTRANARARNQPSLLTLNFGTFLTARITPLSAEGRVGIAYGVGCA